MQNKWSAFKLKSFLFNKFLKKILRILFDDRLVKQKNIDSEKFDLWRNLKKKREKEMPQIQNPDSNDQKLILQNNNAGVGGGVGNKQNWNRFKEKV